ncbi:MAG TPA: ABC transporter permease subunit [Thermomicrobiaceae bacterium]|nr:ABC transporter permease subunit [Thermomicrobiaceae bacterium]
MVHAEHRAVADELVDGWSIRIDWRAWAARPLTLLGWLALAILLLLPVGCFLLLAVTPRLFDQGTNWLTLSSFGQVLSGPAIHGLADSLLVGVASAALALAIAGGLAWVTERTTLVGRSIWALLVWGLLLTPSYLAVFGWETLVSPSALLYQTGLPVAPLTGFFFGPGGVIWILATKGVPFAYLAIAAALGGIGREYGDAARVHGAGRLAAARVLVAILAPACWSALAIVFAESISDFGVASTVAASAHFPVATYTLYLAIDTMPIQFPVAAAVGWCLIAMAALALIVQYRALRDRSYAVLSGRTRPAARRRLGLTGQILVGLAVALFFALALGVPAVGAVIASLLPASGHAGISSLTLANYRRVLGTFSLIAPMLLSGRLAAITATLAVVGGAVLGRLIARPHAGVLGRGIDMLLVGSLALPSIVLAAGYIFAYNLPILARLHVDLYGTLLLMQLAYLAAALPTSSRLLVAPWAQLQASVSDAARVHGAGPLQALRTAVIPLLLRGLVWVWLLTFAGTFLELPISQLLYPPGQPPLSVGIMDHLANYDFAGGSALTILAALSVVLLVAIVLGLLRLLAPERWQRVAAR